MWSNEPRSLPDWVERGYEILSTEITEAGHEEGLSRDRARDDLVAHEDFPDNPADADYAIDELLNSGWLYEVAGKLRVTDPGTVVGCSLQTSKNNHLRHRLDDSKTYRASTRT